MVVKRTGYTTYQLCDLEQVISPLCLGFLICNMGMLIAPASKTCRKG